MGFRGSVHPLFTHMLPVSLGAVVGLAQHLAVLIFGITESRIKSLIFNFFIYQGLLIILLYSISKFLKQ